MVMVMMMTMIKDDDKDGGDDDDGDGGGDDHYDSDDRMAVHKRRCRAQLTYFLSKCLHQKISISEQYL